MKKLFPNKIKIIIQEREIDYILQLADSYVYINKQGYILEISNEKLSVPLILGLTTDLNNIELNDRLNEEDIEKLKTISKIMENAEDSEISSLITRIDATDIQNYTLYLDSVNKTIYLGKCDELNTRFLYIKAILKEQEGKKGEIYVNNLNDGYVYFKEK